MKARILVVEDERAIQIALSGLLRREGYEVEVASSGEQALARLSDAVFDLVLTDLALGRGPSGMEGAFGSTFGGSSALGAGAGFSPSPSSARAGARKTPAMAMKSPARKRPRRT